MFIDGSKKLKIICSRLDLHQGPAGYNPVALRAELRELINYFFHKFYIFVPRRS